MLLKVQMIEECSSFKDKSDSVGNGPVLGRQMSRIQGECSKVNMYYCGR
jgi:hypothetical protein